MDAQIVKIGNSQGVRLSRAYLDKVGVKTGDRVEVLVQKKAPDYKKALQALRELSEMNGALAQIKDPVAWQRKIRKDRPLPGRS